MTTSIPKKKVRALNRTVEKAYVFRIYPTYSQVEQINKTIGCARFVYNYFLDKRITAYCNTGETLSYKECSLLLTRLKRDKDHVWLQEVDKFALQNSLRDLNTAYINFFRDFKKGKIGFPKFKTKHKSKQKYRTNYTNGNIAVDMDSCRIRLPKLGWVRFRKNKKLTELPEEIINAIITKTSSGKYFASVTYKAEVRHLPETENTVGYDLGIITFAIGSNGDIIENPRHFQREQKKLKKLQRKLSRMVKGSNNYIKQRTKIACQHEHIANMRKDFLHKESTRIVRENQVICLEDLQVKEMLRDGKRKKISKLISDTGWRTFRNMIQYKSDWYGRLTVIIDKEYPSTAKCGICGNINPMLTLNMRKWKCPECGTIHDRDKNASQNILNEGLRLLTA